MTHIHHNTHVGLIEPPSATNMSLAFHQRLPGYTPTPLTEAKQLAANLGIGQIWAKQESCRLGMPAFKILGASWATYRALERRLGHTLAEWNTLDELRTQIDPLRPLTLVAATDGNHGRAVARMAGLLALGAQIFVPAGTTQARIDAIAAEGADVQVIDGSYDDAVAHAATLEGPHHMVISDTAWEGYERIPNDVIAGYDTIFREADAQIAEAGAAPPDLVFVQIGVGALAAAVVRHYRFQGATNPPTIIGVEPDSAACLFAAMQAGNIVEVPGPHPSIMAGLNAGLASPVALPDVSRGISTFLAIPDDRARQAMRALAADGIVAGETGAAGAAGLITLMTDPDCAETRSQLGIGPHTRALIIVSEGATDPESYTQIVGSKPSYSCPNPGQCTCRMGRV